MHDESIVIKLVLAMSIAGKRPENSPEPIGATAIGLLLSLSVLIWVPIMAVYQLKKADGDSIIEVGRITNDLRLKREKFHLYCFRKSSFQSDLIRIMVQLYIDTEQWLHMFKDLLLIQQMSLHRHNKLG